MSEHNVVDEEKGPDEAITPQTRRVRIEWDATGPIVRDLTGTEARGILRQVLLRQRETERQLSGLAGLVVSFMHRDASRGLVGADGRPVLPLVTEVPAAHARAGHAPTWELEVTPQPDGSLVVRAHDRSPPAPALVETPPAEAAVQAPGSVTR